MGNTLLSEIGLILIFGFLVSPLASELIKRKLKLVDNGALVLSMALAVLFGFLAVVRSRYAGDDVCGRGQFTVLHVLFDVLIVFGLSQVIFKTVVTWISNKLAAQRARRSSLSGRGV